MPITYEKMQFYTCNVHGELPTTSFCAIDLRVHRHRCKQCLVQGTQQWRTAYPMRHAWSLFVQKARRRFGVDVKLTWSQDGQAVLHRLLKQHQAEPSSITQYVLTWPKGSETLDLQQLVLFQRCQAMSHGV